MPKYGEEQKCSFISFPKVGQKQKKRKKEKRDRRERERPKVGNNNGQLRIATKPWLAHAKPPGPIIILATKCFL